MTQDRIQSKEYRPGVSMPSYVRPLTVTTPLENWTDVALLECHDYAPLFSGIIYTLSAKYGDRDGWVDARYAAPGAILRTLGPVAVAMRLTKPQASAVLDALSAHGHLERSEDGAVRMAGHAAMMEHNSAAIVRSANSARQRDIHARRIKHLADKPVLTVEPSTLTHEPSTLTHEPSTLTHEPAACHDAPVDTTSLDLYLQRSPSGSGPKKEEGGGTRSQAEGHCMSLPGRASPSPAGPSVVTKRDAQAIVALARMDREDKDAPMPVRLTTFFLARLLAVKPDRKVPSEPVILRWVNDMRLLLKDRGDREADIRAVIEWAMTDARFWQAALQSPGKLRSAFDELETKTRAARRRSEPPPVTYLNLAPSPSVQDAMDAVKGMKPSDVMRMFPGRTAIDVHDEAKREYPDLFIEDAIRALKARYDGQREVSHA